MSYALNRSGIKLMPHGAGSLKGDDGFYYWIKVTELKQFLKNRFKKPDVEYTPKKITASSSTKDYEERGAGIASLIEKITNKHGVIVFDVEGWNDATGHFTLWDGENLVYVGEGEHNNPHSTEYYFWLIRPPNARNIITQTTKISFWELK